jgi:hypothetical protein
LPQTTVAGLLVAEVLAKDFRCRAWAAHLLLVTLAFGLNSSSIRRRSAGVSVPKRQFDFFHLHYVCSQSRKPVGRYLSGDKKTREPSPFSGLFVAVDQLTSESGTQNRLRPLFYVPDVLRCCCDGRTKGIRAGWSGRSLSESRRLDQYSRPTPFYNLNRTPQRRIPVLQTYSSPTFQSLAWKQKPFPSRTDRTHYEMAVESCLRTAWV